MNADKIEQLMELIGELVNEEGPYQDRRDAFHAQLSEDDKTNLFEFVAWWQEEEEENEEDDEEENEEKIKNEP